MNILKTIKKWFTKPKGKEIEWHTGLIYAPYIPLIKKPTITEFGNKAIKCLGVGNEDSTLWPRQKMILNTMQMGSTFLEADRQTGKSSLLTIYAAYNLLTKSDTTIFVKGHSNTNPHLFLNIIKLIDQFSEEFGVKFTHKMKSSVTLSNGSKLILSRNSKLIDLSNTLRGYKNIDALLCDEFAFWDKTTQKALMEFVKLKNTMTHIDKIHMSSTENAQQLNQMKKQLPDDFEKLNLLIFDKDEQLGNQVRDLFKGLGENYFKREYGTLFRLN